MNEYTNANIDKIYQKLDYLQKKVEEIENILLLPEEKLSEKEVREFIAARSEIVKSGGTTIEQLERKRRAH
ncbi:hypothetical protein HY988_06150 [Candidatus Micrarchaeota archaeon]|nr:hypothetical protein [Candidatus Micrarchaeota archaeon]